MRINNITRHASDFHPNANTLFRFTNCHEVVKILRDAQWQRLKSTRPAAPPEGAESVGNVGQRSKHQKLIAGSQGGGSPSQSTGLAAW